VTVISSTANPKVRWVKRLQSERREREAQGLFVVEGIRLVREAAAARAGARLVLHDGHLGPQERSLINALARLGAEVEQGSEAVLRACSDTKGPPGLLAVLEQPRLAWPERPGLVLVLDRIADPGNLGAMLRTARAAGVEAALLIEGSVDAYNPKVVRGAMGAHFTLPQRPATAGEALGLVKGMRMYVADARKGVAYDQVAWQGSLALVVGGEARGADELWGTAGGQAVHIPMAEGTESLNTSVAAGILLFEIRRRRGGA
jgi:TrmH family RNA methyltransferase